LTDVDDDEDEEDDDIDAEEGFDEIIAHDKNYARDVDGPSARDIDGLLRGKDMWRSVCCVRSLALLPATVSVICF